MIKKTVFLTLLSVCGITYNMQGSDDNAIVIKPNYTKTQEWQEIMNALLLKKMEQDGIRRENYCKAECVAFEHKMKNGCEVGRACYILPNGLKVTFTVKPDNNISN
jgi:hypothetical protein